MTKDTQQPLAGHDTRIDFCGVGFHALTPAQTLQQCKAVTAQEPFRYLVTPNVDHVVRLSQEPEIYAPLYNGSWISVCDSRILELLAQKSGVHLPAVPGSDLTAQLFENIIDPTEAMCVIGGDADVLAKVKARYGLTQLYHHEPPMGLRTNPKAVQACAAFMATHKARFTFICVGSPQQEMIAQAAEQRGDCVGLGLCVGASLDFLAGKIKRAPKWMQKLRAEWLYRLLSEPKRLWKRYLVDGPKIFLIWRKWLRSQK
jgi:exopolysaccharide biosynthesis WecB/TagA/CpsF family protein